MHAELPVTRTPLSKVDTAWLHMESPTNHMVVTSVLLFDEPVDVHRLRRVLAMRMLGFERFRQRVVTPLSALLAPQWETDLDFDLDHHLHQVRLPAPGGDDELRALVGDLMSMPLDPSQALWQAYVVHGYGDGGALVTRVHHCIADGIALVRVLLSLTDTEPDGDVDGIWEPWRHGDWAAARRQRRGIVASTAHLAVRGVGEALQVLIEPQRVVRMAGIASGAVAALVRVSTLPTEPPNPLRGTLGTRKCVAWSQPIPLTHIKEIGHVVGGTVNDVLMTAATGALRRFLVQQGDDVHDIELHATVPVNLRHEDAAIALGNRFGLVYPALPVGIADPLRRLRAVKEIMDGLKATPEALVAIVVLDLLGRSPKAVEHAALNFFSTKSSTVLTNVPGPREVHYLAGSPVRRILVWAPPSGGISTSISILSYAGAVTVGLATDERLVGCPQAIIDAFAAELAVLAEAGRRQQARRRGGNRRVATA